MSNTQNFSVGPGVQAAIDANGADTRSDEQYVVPDAGKKSIAMCA